MNKLKALAATTLVTSTIAFGGLAAAPVASAQPARSVCEGMAFKGRVAANLGDIYYGLGDFGRATRYYGQSEAYFDAATDCFRSLR